MCQSQVSESQDSNEATSSTMSQLKQTPPSTSNYYVVPEQGDEDRPVNPYGQH